MNLDPRTQRFREEYQGKHFFTKNGKREFVITDARTYGDVDIEFIGSGIKKNTKIGNIKNGLPDPFEDEVIAFDTVKQRYDGCIYPTNQGYYVRVTNYINTSNVEYVIIGFEQYTFSTTIQNIRKGQIRNPFHPNKFGGYLGIGPYNGDKYGYVYNVWSNLLIRANDVEYYKKYHTYATDAYDNTFICQEWLCYNNFADWYVGELNKLTPGFTYDIDKDIMFPFYKDQTNGLKCYSPSTCLLVPHELNNQIQFTAIRRNSLDTNKSIRLREVLSYISIAKASTLKFLSNKCISQYTCDNILKYLEWCKQEYMR